MNYRKLLIAVVAPTLLLTITPSSAIEEIIVTAQHREQSIQDVPISVSALNEELIEKADIFDANSISVQVPGFTFAEFAPGQALLSFRGITSVDDGAGLDNSTAAFLDGVYIGRLAGINFDLFDIEQIEVLKGPQGTLFGRNAIGGVINIATKKPQQEFAAKVGLTVGNEGIFRYQGYVTGGITDSLSGKLVVNHREHDGFVRNVFLNTDTRDEDQTSFRGQLRWQHENMDWVLSADTMTDERAGPGRFPLADGAPVTGIAESLNAGLTNPFTTASPVEGFTDREISGISLQGDIEFSNGTLTTITGVRSVESSWEMPSIGVPLIGGFDLDAGVFGIDVIDDIEEEVDTFSQEFRWTSNLDGKFNYVAGLYFFTEDTDRAEQFRLDSNTVATGQIVIGNEWTRTENETTSYAVYFQGDYQINDQWSATLGARWTRDERDYVASAANCGLSDAEITAAGLPLSVCSFTGLFNDINGTRVGGSLGIVAQTFIAEASADFSDFSPKASLQYRPNENVMLFSTVSTGYKAGGFAGSQGVEAAATTIVEPEGAINYEIGFKSDLFNNTLRLNATAFFVDYTDLQVVRFGPSPIAPDFGSFQTENIDSADIRGIELDFIWQITDAFSLTGNYGYLDTEVNDGLFLPGCPGAANPDTLVGGTDCSGLPLRQAPENTYALTADYALQTRIGAIDFRVQYNHVDENHHDFSTLDETVTNDHDLVDARVAWTSNDGKYNVALWAKNLTDEAFSSHAFRIGPGSIAVWNDPRTVGVTGTFKF